MRISRTIGAVAGLMLAAGSSSVWAQTQPVTESQARLNDASQNCGASMPQRRDEVAACTYVIANAVMSPRQLANLLYNRGLAQMALEDRLAASADFEASILIDPTQGRGWYGRAELLRASGDTAGAMAAYNEATRREPAFTIPYTRRAIILLEARDLPAVVAEMDRLLAVSADSFLGYRIRGIAKFRQGMNDAALADLNEAVRLGPNEPYNYRFRGDVHRARGDDLRAFSDYDRAVSITPSSAEFLYERGNVLHDMGRHADAVADYEAIVRMGNPTYAVLNALCWTRAVWGQQLDQALANCNESIRLERDASNVDSRALVHLKRGDAAAAEADYDAAFALNPELFSALYGRGVARVRLGREAEGRADLAAALAKDATVTETWAGYGVPTP